MVNKNTGTTKLSQIYNNNTIRIKDLYSASSHSLKSYTRVRQLRGRIQSRSGPLPFIAIDDIVFAVLNTWPPE